MGASREIALEHAAQRGFRRAISPLLLILLDVGAQRSSLGAGEVIVNLRGLTSLAYFEQIMQRLHNSGFRPRLRYLASSSAQLTLSSAERAAIIRALISKTYRGFRLQHGGVNNLLFTVHDLASGEFSGS